MDRNAQNKELNQIQRTRWSSLTLQPKPCIHQRHKEHKDAERREKCKWHFL